MLALALRFPGGHYHATPWGHHVNEGEVAWPPDLWRLARALVATWHRKLNPDAYPQAGLELLLATLAKESPVYRLPAAARAHSRHYMPAREGSRDKSTLIFDAFAHVDREAELIIAWPSLDLTPELTAFLDELLEKTSYVGRAESWVEARRLAACTGEPDCFPGEKAVDPVTGEVREVVSLYLPRTPQEYAGLRARLRESLAAREIKPRERTQIEKTLPERWLDALCLQTADLQQAGWNQPPAARVVQYVRPGGCLKPAAIPRPKPSVYSSPVTTARFALYGKPLPRVEDAVRIGEWLRAAVMGKAKHLLGDDRIPRELSGHGLPEYNRHRHAFYLPEDADGDGRVDHAIVYVAGGLSTDVCRVLAQLLRLWNREGEEWQLVLEQIGEAKGAGTESALCGAGLVWASVTPYLHPWHVKKDLNVPEQIRRECQERGLPEPLSIKPVPDLLVRGRRLRPIQFHRFRSKRGLIQPDRRGSFWIIEFGEPVWGPLALGFACHFGLGLFTPATNG